MLSDFVKLYNESSASLCPWSFWNVINLFNSEVYKALSSPHLEPERANIAFMSHMKRHSFREAGQLAEGRTAKRQS